MKKEKVAISIETANLCMDLIMFEFVKQKICTNLNMNYIEQLINAKEELEQLATTNFYSKKLLERLKNGQRSNGETG